MSYVKGVPNLFLILNLFLSILLIDFSKEFPRIIELASALALGSKT